MACRAVYAAPELGACPDALSGMACPYAFSCTSGTSEVTYHCDGTWSVNDASCAYNADVCTEGDARLTCLDGNWKPGGFSDIGVCPAERPEGEPCGGSSFITEPPCGYGCDDGTTWTVAECDYASRTWHLDGACPN